MRLIIEARVEGEPNDNAETTIVATVPRPDRSIADLGLTLDEGRALLAEVQSVLVSQQTAPIPGKQGGVGRPLTAYRAHRGQATHPQGKPVDGLCEVRACDHRSPTTAYGLTRFACRAAVFVGVDAMQDKNKRCASVCETGMLAVLPKGPAPPAAGNGPAPSGRSPEESGVARQPVLDHDSRPCPLNMAMKLATRSRLQLQPLHTATHKTPPRAAAAPDSSAQPRGR